MGKVFELRRYRRGAASRLHRAAPIPSDLDGSEGVDLRAALFESERRVLMALLLDAVRTYKKYAFSGNRRGQRLFQEIEDWFFGGDGGDDDAATIPFELLSQLLDLDADRIRRHLSSWRSTNAARAGRPRDDAALHAGHHRPSQPL